MNEPVLSPRHALLALAVVAVWGSNFVVVRVGLEQFPPFLLAGLRFTFAALPGVFFLRRPRVRWANMAAYGLLIGGGQFGMLFFALDGRISPGLASLVVQSQVFFTIFLSMMRVGERVRGFQIVACLLAVAGIGVIMLHVNGSTTPVGVILVLIAAASWAGGNIVVRESRARNALAYVVWASLFSAPPLLIASLLHNGPAAIAHAVTHATIGGWAVVFWQSLGNTWFGYASWAYLFSRYPSATVAPLSLLVPVFGMTTSALWLGEPMPSWKFAAGALVIAGLAISVFYPRWRAARAA